MKKSNQLFAIITMALGLGTFAAHAQDAPRPKQEQQKNTSSDDAPLLTTKGLHKEHEGRKDPEAREALDEVERASKSVNESTDAFLVLYNLDATKERMSEKIKAFGKEYKEDLPKADAIKMLTSMINQCNSAKKEADNAASAKVNYTEADKQTIKDYQDLYTGIIKKLNVALKEKQN